MISFAFKNHYERLGVGQDASVETIRRAFRQLARHYHPDVSENGKDSREVFVLINEAHQTLTDPERRAAYDEELATSWKFRTPSGPPPTPKHSGLGEAGSGSRFKTKSARQGRPRTRKRPDLDNRATIEIPLEDVLQGALHTVTVDNQQPVGSEHSLTTYEVRIPKLVWAGQQLRLAGCGLQDPLTKEHGDLYLTIQYARHKQFRVMGANLLTEVEVTPWDAVLGAFMRIPCLEGDTSLRIPEGAQPGQRFRLEGYGLPKREGGRGDMIISLRVSLPAAESARQKAFWKALAREYKKT